MQDSRTPLSQNLNNYGKKNDEHAPVREPQDTSRDGRDDGARQALCGMAHT